MKSILNFLRRIILEQKGLAAVPTIISAISVVAVAGTLATSVMSQGNDASQEVDQAVHEAIQNVRNTWQVRGSVIGITTKAESGKAVAQISFTVSLVIDGGSVDFTPPLPSANNTGLAEPSSSNVISFSYTDEYQHVDNLYWTLDKLGKNDGDYFLEDNEMFQITIGGSRIAGQGGNLVDAMERDLTTNTRFIIEIKTPQGATLSIERATPSALDNIVNFH